MKVRHPQVVVAAAKLVDELARALAARPEICEAYLFGSQARGDSQPHSDVDVSTGTSRSTFLGCTSF